MDIQPFKFLFVGLKLKEFFLAYRTPRSPEENDEVPAVMFLLMLFK
jgi:hypothetical protein